MPISNRENHRHLHRHEPPQWGQRKLVLFFLKCIIMVAVVSLFLFFLGFAAFILVHFLFLSKTFNRRCNRFFHPNNDAESLHPLPVIVYSAADFPMRSDCAICLDSFEEGEECRDLLGCKHLFHAKCVDRWIRKRPTCPVCRTRVDSDPDGLPGSRISDDGRWKRLWAVDFEEGTSY